MRKNILILTLITITLLNYGCSSSSSSDDSTEKYHIGTKGLEMSFMGDAPPNTVYEGDAVSVMVQYFNRGATDVAGGTIYLSGFDSKYLPLSPTSFNINAKGKSIYNPDGSMPYIATSQAGYVQMSYDTDSLNQKIKATACYPYKTIAGAEVCIDPRSTNVREDVCNVHDISLSGGQGGPVAVTKIEEEMAANRVMFKIYFSNVGGGDVIDKNYINNCHTDLKIENMDRVYVDSVSYSEKRLNCEPQNPVILQNGQGFVYCYYQGESGKDAYITQLKVQLSYGYRESIEKDIKIYNLPGSN